MSIETTQITLQVTLTVLPAPGQTVEDAAFFMAEQFMYDFDERTGPFWNDYAISLDDVDESGEPMVETGGWEGPYVVEAEIVEVGR